MANLKQFKFTPIPRRVLIRTEPLATYRAKLAAIYRETRHVDPDIARLAWAQVSARDRDPHLRIAKGFLRIAKAYVDQVMNEPSGQ